MIYLITTRRNSFPINKLLRSNGSHLVDKLKLLNYEDLGRLRDLPAGVVIFSDLDFLNDAQRQVARALCSQLRSRYSDFSVYNDPSKVLLRYELLKKFQNEGRNSYAIFKGDETIETYPFPVFIRERNRHTSTLTPLLYNENEVRYNLAILPKMGYSLSELLVVQYLDSRVSENVYSKYSAYRLGDRIMPRYLNFSTKWPVKSDIETVDPLMAEKHSEIVEYMETNPHKEWLMEVFDLAGIEYGRADYSIIDGKFQLWEINLNPAFVRPPKDPNQDNPQQLFMRNSFYEAFFDQIEKVDTSPPGRIKLDISDEMKKIMQRTYSERLREGFRARVNKNKLRYKLLKMISRGMAGFLLKIKL